MDHYSDPFDDPHSPEPRSASEARDRWSGWLRGGLHLALILALVIAGAAVYVADRVFIVVPAGHVGALWNRFTGTRVDRVFGEGLHIISPLDKMTFYEVRQQLIKYDLDVLSEEGLTLTLQLAIRFRPVYGLAGMLHEYIGPNYLSRVIIPQTESIFRKELGNATAEEIYTNDKNILSEALLKAIKEAGRHFVEVEDMIIRTVRLPPSVRTAIDDKLRQSQILASYEFRRQIAINEANRVRIEGEGMRDYQAIVDETLSERLLVQQGIEATRTLTMSDNPKTLVIGAGSSDLALPIFLGDKESKTPLSELGQRDDSDREKP